MTTPRTFLVFLSIHILLALLFMSIPEIDLWFSGLFFLPGEGFFFDNASSKTFLPFIAWTTAIFINGAILLLVVNWLRERRVAKRLLLDNRKIIFLVLTLALGPGLLVNVFLKSHWGRARPSEVSTFGGRQSFSPAYVIAHQCSHNCSFVSGDAAMGYYLIAFLFVARKRARLVVLAGALAGSAIGLIRIAQGAHFLSDVIFAGFVTVTVGWLLSFLMLRPDEESESIFTTKVVPVVAEGLAQK
jgi:lipid A 4'-phosphatase